MADGVALVERISAKPETEKRRMIVSPAPKREAQDTSQVKRDYKLATSSIHATAMS